MKTSTKPTKPCVKITPKRCGLRTPKPSTECVAISTDGKPWGIVTNNDASRN